MKKIGLLSILFFSFFLAQAQGKDGDAVKKVLKTYQENIEKLDTTGVGALFLPGARVFEGGKDEGGIEGYLGHHLGPELKGFKSFTYSDYKVDVKVIGDYAYTVETYLYTIVLAKDNSQVKSQGVATSVLRKTKAGWKIEMTHGSYRRAR
ncbi:nuclear transport factor 2 family protein [Flavisolibacter sp. BT320]|nr:nuclear transport factor 2 family protein [Flavisolibacter longurius]HUC79617.1 nuclear transport factor 2 family protein [Flavisolibacter sp.]